VTEEDDILAAEYALGLLDEAAAMAVQARARTDGPLSLRIAWWRDQFAPLSGEVATPAPPGVWKKIETQLPVNDNVDAARPWKWATSAMSLVAAALLAVILLQPAPVPVIAPPAAVPMMAALSGDKGAVVAVSYEATSGRLTIAPTVLDPGKGDAELWVIPESGKPRSLGVVNAKLVEPHVVPADDRGYILPGATLAITQEVKGGSPNGQPAGPIVAAGKILRT
jgi:anti-sigma-K factor RskA